MKDQWARPLGSVTAAEFERMQVPAGQIGEIVVAGEHVLKGYLHHRGNEETKFSVGGEGGIDRRRRQVGQSGQALVAWTLFGTHSG